MGKRWGLEHRAKPSIPPVNTVPHGGLIKKHVGKEVGLRFHQPVQYHTVVRSKACEERGGTERQARHNLPHQHAVPHGGQIKRLVR